MTEIRAMVDRAILMKREEMKVNPEAEEDTDLLASLLKVKDENTGEGIPDNLIRDEALTFLFAGHDTTSSLLSWCMDALARNPEIVRKLREEIESVLGNRKVVEFDDVKNFKYCEMVLKETLRMRPPVPILDRAVKEDIMLGDNLYRGGTYIYPLLIAAHFDNRYWKKPFEFRPERFDPANKGVSDPVPHPFAFLPFSGGSRNCIGKRFSMIEAIIAVVTIIRQFDVTTKQSQDDIIWHFEGTVKPTNFLCSFTPINLSK